MTDQRLNERDDYGHPRLGPCDCDYCQNSRRTWRILKILALLAIAAGAITAALPMLLAAIGW